MPEFLNVYLLNIGSNIESNSSPTFSINNVYPKEMQSSNFLTKSLSLYFTTLKLFDNSLFLIHLFAYI